MHDADAAFSSAQENLDLNRKGFPSLVKDIFQALRKS